MRVAEKQHYSDLLETNKTNMAKQQSIIKDIIGKKKKAQVSKMFKLDNKILIDKVSITNASNKYFVNVGPSLAQKIPEQNKKPKDLLIGNYNLTMFLMPCTPQEIISVVNGLKNSAGGVDGFQTDVIKHVYMT